MRKTFFAALLFFSISCCISAQSPDFNTTKNIDIYFSILRELSLYYVDSIQTDKLIHTGIDAMLESLDPYTEYVPAEATEAFDFATTGAYGGIGSLIRRSDQGIQITGPYQGFPADKAGLVPGDCIIEIEGKSTKNMPADTGSTLLKGPAGSVVKLKVAKLKTGDTVDLQIARERIHLSDINYYGIIKDSVGYIHVSSFTKGGSRDFAKAFHELKKTGKMKSLLLDFRANGGGLLDEAVNIVGMFVPKGTTIVEARGRLKDFEATYVTREKPLDTKIPIAIVVNSMSASSSEIVAGAFQDLDRGIVVGTRTFGKGLVQSVRNLSYNSKLKITTAKYYTPSGRCVQIVDYSHRREDGSVGAIPDSLIQSFKTRNGRTVYDGGGITPDTIVELQPYNKISYRVVTRDLIWPYALSYFTKHSEIAPPETFKLTDEEYDDYVNYLLDKDFDDKTDSEILLEQLVKTTQADHIYDSVKSELDALHQKIARDKQANLVRFKPELKKLLEEEICSIYYYQQGRLRNALPQDEQINKAIELLHNPAEYNKITGN
jgi:carboxyl-terminal processing protease